MLIAFVHIDLFMMLVRHSARVVAHNGGQPRLPDEALVPKAAGDAPDGVIASIGKQVSRSVPIGPWWMNSN